MTKWIFSIVFWLLAMRSMISTLELMDTPRMKRQGAKWLKSLVRVLEGLPEISGIFGGQKPSQQMLGKCVFSSSMVAVPFLKLRT